MVDGQSRAKGGNGIYRKCSFHSSNFAPQMLYGTLYSVKYDDLIKEHQRGRIGLTSLLGWHRADSCKGKMLDNFSFSLTSCWECSTFLFMFQPLKISIVADWGVKCVIRWFHTIVKMKIFIMTMETREIENVTLSFVYMCMTFQSVVYSLAQSVKYNVCVYVANITAEFLIL